MIKYGLAVILALLPLCALAQDDAAAAPVTPSYNDYAAGDFGFSIKLPATGEIEDPSSEGWAEDAEVAFNWYYAGEEPIVLIQGRVDKFETELDAETFQVFCDTLLSNWTGDPAKYAVVTSNEQLDLNGMRWNLIEVEDGSDANGTKVYYSVFSTYAGSSIYTVSMYYLEPVNDGVQEFGFPVLDGFKLVTQ